jgi:hypothetical protein
MKTNQKLLKEFKDIFGSTNPPLDFRRDVFAPNDYCASPVVTYDRAKDIVVELYDWAHTYIDDNEEMYPDFSGWVFNTEMEVDKLRSSKINNLVNNVISDLINFQNENKQNVAK